RAQCQNNLKQLGIAINNFECARGILPPGRVNNKVMPEFDANTKLYQGWGGFILPYIEQANVASIYDLSKDCRHIDNQPAVSTVLPLFLCPSSPQRPLQHTYTVSSGDRTLTGRTVTSDPVNQTIVFGVCDYTAKVNVDTDIAEDLYGSTDPN